MSERVIDLDGAWEIRGDGDAAWRGVTVPAAWQTVFGADDPEAAWYRRDVELPKSPAWREGRVWLRFEAAATHARVFVNGCEVGRHSGDWVPFQCEATGAVREGRLRVEVRVDKDRAGAPLWIDGAPVCGGHITKGFHDVLSVQHGGLWDSVSARSTGRLVIVPNGVSAAVVEGMLRVRVELEAHAGPGVIEDGATGEVLARVNAGDAECVIARPYAGERKVQIRVRGEGDPAWLYDEESAPVIARRVDAEGNGGRGIRIDGAPVFLRGVLDWGHELATWAPAASEGVLRERFARLRDLGFNCLCVCMWYPPERYYRIAAEMGLLVWQEHPVWKSPMEDFRAPEYERLFTEFMRRDARHPATVIVSGACEHERFNPRLAEWWWRESRDRLPGVLRQVQTAFLSWSDLTKTDLYDEHTYESAGKWVSYLKDVEEELEAMVARGMARRPFIMGEAVLYTSWPDTRALRARCSGGRPWWMMKGLESCERLEAEIRGEYGEGVLERFVRQGDRYNLMGRKFQVEMFRRSEQNAGLVMNHLNDVAQCRCGFVDDLGTWRFAPRDTQGWLSAAAVLLETPEQRRGFAGGSEVTGAWVISNFSERAISGDVRARVGGLAGARVNGDGRGDAAAPGRVSRRGFSLTLPETSQPTAMSLGAEVEGAPSNAWTLWVMPRAGEAPAGVVVCGNGRAGVTELDFEEKKYSSGWGLPVRSWTERVQEGAAQLPGARRVADGELAGSGARVCVCSALTDDIVAWAARGGRVVLLAGRGKGIPPTKSVCMWGQNPLIIERGPIGAGESDWIADLLDYDLTRRHLRAMTTSRDGLSGMLDPLIRLLYTHDMQDEVVMYDVLAMARLGAGVIVISTLDHGVDAGAYLLHRVCGWLVETMERPARSVPVEVARAWAAG